MFSSQLSSFLELAVQIAPEGEREAVLATFGPKLDAVSDDAEFDLALWSLAQRLRTDTEELLRRAGGLWILESGISEELGSDRSPLQAIGQLVQRLENGDRFEAPLPGLAEFSVKLLSDREDRVNVACEGPRRCCSFLEGMARALCERSGKSLRYLRQPKRATTVTISFSVIG